MKSKRYGFTVVELLTVITIIAMLVAILVPSLSMVRNTAKKTQQKAQLMTIGLAINAFKSNYGDYPPSAQRDDNGARYCGAERLAEAMMGQDLLGFHPDSRFADNGEDVLDTDLYPPNLNPTPGSSDLKNMQARKGPYLDVTTANAFTLDKLFNGNTGPLTKEQFVLCDVFGVKKITLTQISGKTVTFKAGTPILYYRANTASKVFNSGQPQRRIYDFRDNIDLIRLGVLPDLKPADTHPLMDPGGSGMFFYEDEYKIVDPKASASMAAGVFWPYRPDSYILISAGVDGLYGTSDDITNFGN